MYPRNGSVCANMFLCFSNIYLYLSIFNINDVSIMKKVVLDKIDVNLIKNLLIKIGSPIIPLTLIFESLGYGGITGIEWGILAGAVCAIAVELGYMVEKMGRSIILIKSKEDLIQKDTTRKNET